MPNKINTYTGSTVAGSATMIVPGNVNRDWLNVVNTSGAVIYWGPSTVTTATGYPLGVEHEAAGIQGSGTVFVPLTGNVAHSEFWGITYGAAKEVRVAESVPA